MMEKLSPELVNALKKNPQGKFSVIIVFRTDRSFYGIALTHIFDNMYSAEVNVYQISKLETYDEIHSIELNNSVGL